jgi:DNA-binding GntR family transcriptional regulator
MVFSVDRESAGDNETDRSGPLSAVLEHQIEHLILSGELGPGVRLNEIPLANRFGTSRGPLREPRYVRSSHLSTRGSGNL